MKTRTFNILLALLFNAAMAIMLSPVLPFEPGAIFGALTLVSLIPKSVAGVLPMAIQKEIWENDIIESLWADNAFLNYAYNADQFVLAGKVVHIPQAGAAPGTKVNRSSLPATVTKRTDVDITYAIDEITTDPVHISNAETIELSYDKRRSVLSETVSAINEAVALNMLYRWAPSAAAAIVRTTGNAVLSHTEGAAGNRKAITLADVKGVKKLFDKQSIPSGERYLMLDADMYEQLTNEMDANAQRDFLRVYDEKTGVFGMLYGFKVLMRAQVMRYTNAGTPVPKSWDTAGAATDNAAALAWHKNSVERALGTVNFYEDLGNPTYYGDIYSSLVRLGGRIRRNDNKGIVAIVQAAE
ncbi:MAG: hypothetical protein BWY89_00040 [Bacteroidetes bacterium ADurb.BinA012]|jgi:hypothetical protein|nr:MAG: hypothetical protein BWY89_00040 [Bacteroidetes bacterium ADurb.BinA012]